MSDELKPCPFCGAAALYQGNGAWPVVVTCSNDKCVVVGAETVSDWNTRPVEDALRAEIVRLNAQYYEMDTYGCPDCNGDGEIKGNTCFTCNGHGVLYVKPNEAAE